MPAIIRMVHRHLPFPALAALFLAIALEAWPAQTLPDSAKWETEIRAFESSDRTNPPPRRAVLFVGSSSIRLWKSLGQDFPEHQVINRGFGGSQIADSSAFAHRIIFPYQPRMVVLYAGDNDLAAGKSPQQVFKDFKEFVRTVHSKLPRTRIAFISIKPSPARWHLAEKVRTANRLIQEHCRPNRRLLYVDVFTPMLDPNGAPRPELFVEDRLHLNAEGYALWTSVIRPRLR